MAALHSFIAPEYIYNDDFSGETHHDNKDASNEETNEHHDVSPCPPSVPRKHLMRLNTSPDIMPLMNRRRLFSTRSISVGDFASRRKASEESYYNCSLKETDGRESILCLSGMSDTDPAALEKVGTPTRKISVVERTGVQKVIPKPRSISVGGNVRPSQRFLQSACGGRLPSPREEQPTITNVVSGNPQFNWDGVSHLSQSHDNIPNNFSTREYENRRWQRKSEHDVTSPLENQGFPRYYSEHTDINGSALLRKNMESSVADRQRPGSGQPRPLDKEIRVMKWLMDCEAKGAESSLLPAHLPDINFCDRVGSV